MTSLLELAHRWTAEAELLRGYGAQEAAAAAERHARELEEAIQAAQDEALTLSEAATESGYSKRRLRELVAEETIPNAGKKGAPRIRRGDLPRKAGRGDDGFDPVAEAQELLG